MTFARTDFYNSEFMLTWMQTMCMSNTQFCTRYLYRRDLHKSNVMAHHWSTKAKLCGKGSERMVFYLRYIAKIEFSKVDVDMDLDQSSNCYSSVTRNETLIQYNINI